MIRNVFWQYLIPQRLLSKLVGKLARCRIIWLKNLMILGFARCYAIDLREALEPDLKNYPDLESFFIRKVNPEKRPFPEDVSLLASPVDGLISQIGRVNQGKIVQAKGIYFDLPSLLVDVDIARNFRDGHFATIYLAPNNYHRVYMPCRGTLLRTIYIPGKLFSVNMKTSASIRKLFSKNERLITIFATEKGFMSIILVGAIIVSGIYSEWTRKINSKERGKGRTDIDFKKRKIVLERGKELGYFTFGSTVIMLFSKDTIRWQRSFISPKKRVLIGETIGKIL